MISVGSYSNTFGIPGVKEFAFFLKDVQDARKIRKRLIECECICPYVETLCYLTVRFQNLGFEHASQPGLSDKEKEDCLHFVIVGGGPTASIK